MHIRPITLPEMLSFATADDNERIKGYRNQLFERYAEFFDRTNNEALSDAEIVSEVNSLRRDVVLLGLTNQVKPH